MACFLRDFPTAQSKIGITDMKRSLVTGECGPRAISLEILRYGPGVRSRTGTDDTAGQRSRTKRERDLTEPLCLSF